MPISVSTRPVFTYSSPTRPMADLASLNWKRPQPTERLTVRQFWARVGLQADHPEFLYLSAAVDEKFPEVRPDVHPMDILVPTPPPHPAGVAEEMRRLQLEEGGGVRPDMNVWMGVAG